MFRKILAMFALSFSVLGADESSYRLPGVISFEGSSYELVGDSKDEINRIYAFPFDKYKIYDVPGLGSFYIDYLHDTIKRTLSNGHIWEQNIVNIIHNYARKGSVVVDLGSHIGTHLVSMSQAVGEDGKVFGFEPQMKIFSELVQNMLLNQCQNVIAYRSAVGRSFGEIQMVIPHTSNEGGCFVGQGGDFAPLVPLDSLNLENVSLIKIDVEFYEDEVLSGAEETIRRNRPYIIIELADDTKAREVKRDATIRNLESMGYHLTKLWGWDWFASPI